MSMRSNLRKFPATTRHELQLAAAVAREAVVQLHVDRALELILHAAGRVSAMRMLSIYVRLLGLHGPTEDAVTNRVLASLGEDGVSAGGRTPAGQEIDDDRFDQPSLFRTVRNRLRGRVHEDLRRAVEMQMGVAHAALLETHVQHAHGFVRILCEAHEVETACDVYLELVDVPPSLTSVLYVLVLNRIAAEEMPRLWSPTSPGPERPAVVDARSGPRAHRARRPA